MRHSTGRGGAKARKSGARWVWRMRRRFRVLSGKDAFWGGVAQSVELEIGGTWRGILVLIMVGLALVPMWGLLLPFMMIIGTILMASFLVPSTGHVRLMLPLSRSQRAFVPWVIGVVLAPSVWLVVQTSLSLLFILSGENNFPAPAMLPVAACLMGIAALGVIFFSYVGRHDGDGKDQRAWPITTFGMGWHIYLLGTLVVTRGMINTQRSLPWLLPAGAISVAILLPWSWRAMLRIVSGEAGGGWRFSERCPGASEEDEEDSHEEIGCRRGLWWLMRTSWDGYYLWAGILLVGGVAVWRLGLWRVASAYEVEVAWPWALLVPGYLLVDGHTSEARLLAQSRRELRMLPLGSWGVARLMGWMVWPMYVIGLALAMVFGLSGDPLLHGAAGVVLAYIAVVPWELGMLVRRPPNFLTNFGLWCCVGTGFALAFFLGIWTCLGVAVLVCLAGWRQMTRCNGCNRPTPRTSPKRRSPSRTSSLAW